MLVRNEQSKRDLIFRMFRVLPILDETLHTDVTALICHTPFELLLSPWPLITISRVAVLAGELTM